MILKNPHNLSINQIEKYLGEKYKTKKIITIYGKKVILIYLEFIKFYISKNADTSINLKTQIPLWWNIVAVIISTLIFFGIMSIFGHRNITYNIVIYILILTINQNLYFLMNSSKIKQFRQKVKYILQY
jgi:ATP-dependent Zn protease